jgi:RNA polymerase sigma-54 factor
MRISQEMRQLQKLAPQLIQSLRLLQLPTVELEQAIQQELETNPVLEELADGEVADDEGELPQESDGEEPPDDSSDADESDLELDAVDSAEEQQTDEKLENDIDEAWDEAVDEFLMEDSFEQHLGIRKEVDWSLELRERLPVYEASLGEHLTEQLHLDVDTETQVVIGEYILGNLDKNGFLMEPIEEIAKALEVTLEEVEGVLLVVQTFDPPGVGARDTREALLIQLREKELEETTAYRVVDEQFENLLKRRLREIARKLKVADTEISQALEIISALSPKPASSMFGASEQTVVPDLVLEQHGDDWEIILNDRNTPSLRISPTSRALLQGPYSGDTKSYIRERIESANWLIKSIEQRRSTMLKVMKSIVERQREFFAHGISRLKPMVLQEVADDIDMHVSTVSRVSDGKYVQTPHGVHELKFFFDGGLGSADGDDVSAKATMNRIKEIVGGEDSHKPLSDQAIAKTLQTEGTNIARRTVAKYRDRMRIPPARGRKEL